MTVRETHRRSAAIELPPLHRPHALVVAAYIGALAAAQWAVVSVSLRAGGVLFALLLLILLNHAAVLRIRDRGGELQLALALLPILRLSSLLAPVPAAPLLWWFAMTGVPVAIAVGLAMSALQLRPYDVGLAWGTGRVGQLLIGLLGVPMGLAAFELVKPTELTIAWNARDAVLGFVVLMLFVGALEELVFRGLLQRAAVTAYGPSGILLTTTAFTVLFIGTGSRTIVVAATIGLVLGWLAYRTRSILGVAVARGLVAYGVFILWPHLLR